MKIDFPKQDLYFGQSLGVKPRNPKHLIDFQLREPDQEKRESLEMRYFDSKLSQGCSIKIKAAISSPLVFNYGHCLELILRVSSLKLIILFAFLTTVKKNKRHFQNDRFQPTCVIQIFLYSPCRSVFS